MNTATINNNSNISVSKVTTDQIKKANSKIKLDELTDEKVDEKIGAFLILMLILYIVFRKGDGEVQDKIKKISNKRKINIDVEREEVNNIWERVSNQNNISNK